ncbi:MAG: alpha/beta hydrolase [Solirubrobacterales bacterium]
MRRVLTVAVGVVAALLVVMVVNAYFVNRQTKPAHAGVGRLVALPGGAIQVREDGPRQAPAIVLVHGWTAAINWWDRLTPLLDDSYHVVRVDLLGHGGSAKPRDGYSMEEQADRVATVLEQLGVRRAMVAGHSTGGEVAIALVARHPEQARNLVVIDSEPNESYTTVDLLGKLAVTPLIGQALWPIASDSTIEDGLKQAFATDQVPVPAQFVQDFRDMTFDSFKDTFDESSSYVEDGDLERDFRSVALPEMVIFGAQDRLIDADKSISLYKQWKPGARTALVQGAGHSPMWEQPAKTAGLMVSFDRSSAR